MNNIIDLIKTRVSCPKLQAPAPNKLELEEILACAMRAPDHARLKPWRYHVVTGASLDNLGEVFVQTQQENMVSQVKIEKCRNMPKRAPMIIVAVCEPVDNLKVPKIEQLLAVGAGIQNMQIAISSLGYGSIWRTGDMAHHQIVKKHFNISQNGEIVGFLYIGTSDKQPSLSVLNLKEYVKHWD